MQLIDQTESHNPETEKFPWKLGLTLYSLSYLPMMLFSKAYFWDDWYVYKLKDSEYRALLREAGSSPVRAWIEIGMLDANPVLFRIVTILSYFAVGWFLFHILSNVRFIGAHYVRIVTLLFLILPINSARVSMINFAYSYSLLSFYFAWYLLVTNKSVVGRLASIPLFLISFEALSPLIFFIIPCCHLGYLMYLNPNVKKIHVALIPLALLSIAPLYYIVDRRFNPPLGGYADYYSPALVGIAFASLFLIACAIATSIHFYRHRSDLVDVMPISLLIVGVDVVAIGASPYMVGGHFQTLSEWMLDFVPGSSDWHSRHQLLLGLGFAILITGLLACTQDKFRRYLLFLVISICVLLNMNFMNSYYLDYLKQNEIIAQFRSSALLSNSKVLMIDDKADLFNARGRSYRIYEWNGMLDEAFGSSNITTAMHFSYVRRGDELVPDTLVTISSRNLRIAATLKREVGIEISVQLISPHG